MSGGHYGYLGYPPGTDHAALGIAAAALRAEITHAQALLDRIEAHQ